MGNCRYRRTTAGLIAYALSKLVDPSLVGSNKATMFKNRLVVPLLAGLGLWNIAWYGMRNIETFWGQAAIITGVAMLMASLDLTGRRVLLPRPMVVIALLASFSLYAITLVRLNLGLPIIG